MCRHTLREAGVVATILFAVGISPLLFPRISSAVEVKATYSECAGKFSGLPVAGELRRIWNEVLPSDVAAAPDAGAYSEPWQQGIVQDIGKDASWIYQADSDPKALFDKMESRIKYLFEERLKSKELKDALDGLSKRFPGAPSPAYLIANYKPENPEGIEILALVFRPWVSNEWKALYFPFNGVAFEPTSLAEKDVSELNWMLAIPLNPPCGSMEDIWAFSLGMGFAQQIKVTTDRIRRYSLPIFLSNARAALDATGVGLEKFSAYKRRFPEVMNQIRECCTFSGETFRKEAQKFASDLIASNTPVEEPLALALVLTSLAFEELVNGSEKLFDAWTSRALDAHPTLDDWDAIPMVYYDVPSGLFTSLVVYYGSEGGKGYLFDPTEGKWVEGDTIDKREANGDVSLIGKYVDETHKNGYLIFRLLAPASASYLRKAGNRILSWFTSPAPPPGQKLDVIEMMKRESQKQALETVESMGGTGRVQSVADWFNGAAAAIGVTSGGLSLTGVGLPVAAVGGIAAGVMGLIGGAIQNELDHAKYGEASPVTVATTVLAAAGAIADVANAAAKTAAPLATRIPEGLSKLAREVSESLPKESYYSMRVSAELRRQAEKEWAEEVARYEEWLRPWLESSKGDPAKWTKEIFDPMTEALTARNQKMRDSLVGRMIEKAEKGGGGAAGGIIGAGGGLGGVGPAGGWGSEAFTQEANRKVDATLEWAKGGQGGAGGSGSILDYGKDKSPGDVGGKGGTGGDNKYGSGSGTGTGRESGKGSGSGSGSSGGSSGKDWWSGSGKGDRDSAGSNRPGSSGGSGGSSSGTTTDATKKDDTGKGGGSDLPDTDTKDYDKGYDDYGDMGIKKGVNCAESDDRPGCVGTGSRGSAASAADAAATTLRKETCAKACSGNPDPECLSKCTGGGPTPGSYGEGVEIGFSGGQPRDGGVVCNCPEGATDCSCGGGTAAGSGLGAQAIQAKIGAICTPRPDGTGCEQQGEGGKTQASPTTPGLGPQPKPVGTQQTQQTMKTEGFMTKAFTRLSGFFKGLFGE